MILGKVFSPKAISIHLTSEDKEEAFEELAVLLHSSYPEINREEALKVIREREEKMSTGIKTGIAVPHGKLPAVKGVQGVIGISREGIDYQSLDGKPVHLIFMLLSSPDECEYHLRVLRHLSQILDKPGFYDEIMNQQDADGVYSVLCRYENQL